VALALSAASSWRTWPPAAGLVDDRNRREPGPVDEVDRKRLGEQEPPKSAVSSQELGVDRFQGSNSGLAVILTHQRALRAPRQDRTQRHPGQRAECSDEEAEIGHANLRQLGPQPGRGQTTHRVI
jgi:hypothetical protein